MSLAKYMQLYREYGFFNGSTIRVRIPDTSFYGSDLILSKDGNILRTRTIDDDVVDFFTDESGILVLSADNGSATLSGEVKISAYGTYNITLEGTSVDKSREVYAEKDVTLDNGKTTDSVAIGYTGDISPISATSSNTSVCTVSVNGNKVIVRDAGKDFNGKSTITATVEASQNYDAGEVNFYVNKTNGSLDTWANATDEVLASMLQRAYTGEITLSDYWNIGDKRRVSLSSIVAGEDFVAAQTAQEVDIVLLHDTRAEDYYYLTTPLYDGRKIHPNYAIGIDNCLNILSAIGVKQKSITVIGHHNSQGDNSYTESPWIIENDNLEAEIIDWLDSDLYNALPQTFAELLQSVDVRYCSKTTQTPTSTFGNNAGTNRANCGSIGTKSSKIVLPSLIEITGNTDLIVGNYQYNYSIVGTGVYYDHAATSDNSYFVNEKNSYVINSIKAEGVWFDYFKNANNRKKKQGISGSDTDYFLRTNTYWVSAAAIDGKMADFIGIGIDENGAAETIDFNNETQRLKPRGISPIMFI